ncbi:MAG: alanine racemase [Gammaproteobacteria bacterium]|nr:alanine racemase [Gammaproteobacteria bacterium]
MRHGCYAEINTSALKHNLLVARQQGPQEKIVAVLKANAYGHGMAAVAQVLDSEADAFAVAYLEETVQLIHQTKLPVLVLEGFYDSDELAFAASHNIWSVVHSDYQLELLESARLPKPLHIWLKVDTGMNRLGFIAQRFEEVYKRLLASGNVASLTLMSHLSCADVIGSKITGNQLAQFNALVAGHTEARSVANSAAILSCPQAFSAPGLNWLRPGLMLYGCSPFAKAAEESEATALRVVMTLRSNIVAIRDITVGETVGYGASWCAKRPSRIAVVAIGYGDGYPRHAVEGTPVLVNGRCVPLVGRVSMDMITVDISDLSGVAIGDTVTLWGRGLPLETVAASAGTIAYELLCGLGARVQRRYLQDSEIIETVDRG